MKSPKSKGSSFEREICRLLSIYLTDGKEEVAAWRTTSSGAFSTTLQKRGKKSLVINDNFGDIKQTIPIGLYPNLDNFFSSFVVECKFYKKIGLYPPLDKKVTSFFTQVLEEAKCTNKFPFLVIKQNYGKILCFSTVKFNCLPVLSVFIKDQQFYGYLMDDVVESKYMMQQVKKETL